MYVRRAVILAAAVLGLAACPNNDDDKPTAPSAAPPPPAPPPAASTTELKVEGPAKMAIEPRVRAEIDGRADGITGAALSQAGARASLQTPTGWTTTKGDPTVAASPDKKAQLAVSGLGATESATTKLTAAASALGLASCEWGPTESLTVGKGKLPASAADGVCLRGQAPVRAAYVSPSAESMLVLGTWDEGGDAASVFGAMRTVAKAAGGGDSTGIAACCAALHGNAKVAPPEQKQAYDIAAGLCDAAKNDPNGRAMLGTVRAALRGANMPSSCQ